MLVSKIHYEKIADWLLFPISSAPLFVFKLNVYEYLSKEKRKFLLRLKITKSILSRRVFASLFFRPN